MTGSLVAVFRQLGHPKALIADPMSIGGRQGRHYNVVSINDCNEWRQFPFVGVLLLLALYSEFPMICHVQTSGTYHEVNKVWGK